jgi:ferrochelatase
MPHYLGLPQFDHGSAPRLGVLLVNLGTPDAPTAGPVRRFLAEFLWDPRVIELPRWLWWLVLHGVILRLRPRKSAHAYQQIWTPQGSPLLCHSSELATRLQATLSARFGAGIKVALGMTYGAPGIRTALEQMHREGVRRLVVLPLYPQYSATTTASVFDRVAKTLQGWRWIPELRFVTHYHDDSGYIAAIAASIKDHGQQHPRQHLLFSFHGVPRRYLLAGDPYHCHCLKTARLVSEHLNLQPDDWSVSFQSQVGREEWLRPYTDEVLAQYAKSGKASVTVVCPGFSVDCLETLEEIAIRNRAAFLGGGGTSFEYIPALNATDAHVALLADLVTRHAQGWPELCGPVGTDPHTLERARRAGAAG